MQQKLQRCWLSWLWLVEAKTTSVSQSSHSTLLQLDRSPYSSYRLLYFICFFPLLSFVSNFILSFNFSRLIFLSCLVLLGWVYLSESILASISVRTYIVLVGLITTITKFSYHELGECSLLILYSQKYVFISSSLAVKLRPSLSLIFSSENSNYIKSKRILKKLRKGSCFYLQLQ